MPAYNASKYIGKSIESVINQTYQNWELIIVDDGSVDTTAAVVAQYKSSEPRISYFFQENSKQGKARNLGIKNSTGKYIAFLDADDKWTADKLAVQTQIMAVDENIDLVFSQGYSIHDNNIEDYNVVVKEVWDHNSFSEFVYHNQIPILSVLVKKEVLEQANNFTEIDTIQNAEDYHLWLKLLANGKRFTSIPDRLFYYRMHAGQATFQNSNLEHPVFNAYKDIFYSYTSAGARKPIINKLRWFIFNADFHKDCINLITAYFNDQGKSVLGFIISNLRSKNRLSKKLAFTIVSAFMPANTIQSDHSF